MRFRAFRVDWDTLFFSKIFVSAKRKTHEQNEQDSSVLVRLIVSKFHKNHSQLSYYSLEIVYAVSEALLSVCVSVRLSRFYGLCLAYHGSDFDQT